MSKDPKERFKPFVKQGFITERQRLNLNPAYLDYLTQKNKKRNHKPRRVSDAEWAKVKAKIKEKHRVKQVDGHEEEAGAEEDDRCPVCGAAWS